LNVISEIRLNKGLQPRH